VKNAFLENHSLREGMSTQEPNRSMKPQAPNRFPSPQRGRGDRGEGETAARRFPLSVSPGSEAEPWALIQSTSGPLTPIPSPSLGRGEPRARSFSQLPVLALASLLSMLLASPPSLSAFPANWEARAKEALSRGDLDDARRTAESALQDSSSAAAAHELLGHINYRQKRNEEAIGHFQAASSQGRSGLELTKDWSAALLALGRHSEARELLEKALAQDPSQMDLRYRLAGSYSTQGRWKEAWPHWETAYRQGLRHSGVVLQLARARFAVGQDVEAVELLSGFAATTAAADPLLEAGKLLFEKALYRQALAPLQKVWQQKPGAYDAGMYLALSHYLIEHYAESEKALKEIQAVPEASSEYLLLLGSVGARLGKWDEARITLEDATKRFPQRADGYLNLGLFCLERGDRKRAMDLFDKASRLEMRGNKVIYTIRSRRNCEGLRPPEGLSQSDSTREEPYSQLAEQLYARQQSGSALEVFMLALESDHRSERAYAGIGRICSETDSVPQARAFLEKGLELHPQSAGMHFNLGLAFQALGQPNEAVRQFQQAMELRGPRTSPLDWIQLGTAQQAGGDSKEAENSFLKGLSLDPTLAQGHFELGKLYFQQAAYDRAEKSLEKAIQLDPRLLGAYYQYGLVCMRNGRPERGKTFLNTFHQKKELYAPEASATEPPASP
jgi:tetratricopeptide (TPR) repeat protein